MKNIELFEKLRKQAAEFDKFRRAQKEDTEKLADIAWKEWRADISNKEKEDKFHDLCRQAEQIQKSIERNEAYLGEKWYMTEYLFSDAHAYEVVEVYSIDKMDVRRLKAIEKPEAREARMASFIPGGFVGNFDNSLQEWMFEVNEKEPIITVRRHKDGNFYRAGTRTCHFVPHSEPYEWYDFNF